MSDVNCPYCDKEQDINNDDGYGYEEDKIHNQYCSNCEKTFAYTTSISFYYYPHKADCLNDGEHKWKLSNTYPKKYAYYYCEDCGEEDRTRKVEEI